MIGRLPVVWMEAAGRDYHAQIFIPTEMIMEGLQYVEEVMKPMRHKSAFYMMDHMNATGFTFSYKLYNEEIQAWDFNREELMAKFKALELQMRQS